MHSHMLATSGRNEFSGRRILVVEDDFLIVSEIIEDLEASGAEVIGPAMSVDKALELVKRTPRLDGALLDLNVGGEMAFPVAEALEARGIPYAFATGYDGSVVPKRFSHVAHCTKPIDARRVARNLLGSGQHAQLAL